MPLNRLMSYPHKLIMPQKTLCSSVPFLCLFFGLYSLFFRIDDVEFQSLIIVAKTTPKKCTAAGVGNIRRGGQSEAQLAFMVKV